MAKNIDMGSSVPDTSDMQDLTIVYQPELSYL